MLAAELLVKKAVKPLSLAHLEINGYGFFRRQIPTMRPLVINSWNNIHPTKRRINLPYWVKILIPLVDTELNTSPIIPIGAKLMIQRTTVETPSARSFKTCFVAGVDFFKATPMIADQVNTPR